MTTINTSPEATLPKSLVLIVDDQPRNLQLAASVLSPYYRLLLADSGQKALKIANEKKPDLILLDVMMPGMSGYETCSQLKADAATQDIPVIFLTAKTEEEDIMQAFEVGGVDYVTKPFKAKEVLARIKTQISLRRSEQQLQQHNAFMSRLLTIIGHDLRGPMGSILDMLDIIREHHKTFQKEDIVAYCLLMQQSAAHTTELLNNLLAWSRSQLPSGEVQTQAVSVQQELQKVVYQLAQMAENKNVSLLQQVDAELHIKANANMLQTILRNLISNGIKFTKPGTSITVSATRQNGMAEIAVTDQGIGITPEIIERLLSKKNNYTTYGTKNEKGSGIGLNLCVNLLEQLGSKLHIDSEPEKGSTFRFSLPIVS